jgi:MYXO-CTERM domain-containing protein
LTVSARADTTFDFSVPRAGQTGDYRAEEGARVSAGIASLAVPSDWSVTDARWRISFRVTTTLERHDWPVRLDLAGAPAALFDRSRGDGGDLRVTATDGTAVLHGLERYDWILNEGTLRIRPPRLAAGGNDFHLYFGEPARRDFGDPVAMFRHAAPIPVFRIIDDAAPTADLAVAALYDATRVVVNAIDAVLDAGETLTVPAASFALGDGIAADGPIGVWFAADGADAPAPLAAAATRLAVVSPRYASRICVAAPFGAATVDVRSGTTSVASLALADGEVRCLDADVTDFAPAVVLADVPVLAHHYSTNVASRYDAMVMVPPATRLFGALAGTGRLAALEDATVADVYLSDGTSVRHTLAAGESVALPSPGTQGSGPAVRIEADHPVTAVSYADGDGGEAVPFLPVELLGRTFAVPAGSQYVLAAADRPGTECVLRAPDGTVAARVTADTLAPPTPGRLFFGTETSGTSPIAAGSTLACDGPVWAIAEDGATGDEKTLWPETVFRPVSFPAPGVSFGVLGSRYRAGVAAVVTPTWRPGWGVRRWTAFEERGDTSVPFGSTLRYQLSDDGGATWRIPGTGGWVADAAGLGAEPWDVDAAMEEYAAGEVTVRVLFGSDDGSESPVVDELFVGAEAAGAPDTLVFGPIDPVQRAGVPFRFSLTLLDAEGLPVEGYDGTAALSADVGTVSPAESGSFSRGAAWATAAVDRAAPAVRLRAEAAGREGWSAPFAVAAGEAATLRLHSGDGQFAPAGSPLPEPVAVRVEDAAGNPVQGVRVSFRVTRGGGSLSVESSPTDGAGLTGASWTVGAGANLVEASVEGLDGSPVAFAARGDVEGTGAGDGDDAGGCGCRASGGGGRAVWWIVGLPAAVAFGVRRRRRS